MSAKSANLPAWLLPAQSFTQRDKVLAPLTANWMKLFKHRNELSEKDCLRIVYLELHDRKRPEIIGRVRVWWENRRRARELQELWEYSPGAGKGHQGHRHA